MAIARFHGTHGTKSRRRNRVSSNLITKSDGHVFKKRVPWIVSYASMDRISYHPTNESKESRVSMRKQKNTRCLTRPTNVTWKDKAWLSLGSSLFGYGMMCLSCQALTIPGVVGDTEWREGFVSGLALIFFSEIGDKTFFIAVLLALRAKRSLVFAGTFGALSIMSVISVLLGRVLHSVDEAFPLLQNTGLPLDDVLAVILLVVFGIQTILSAEESKSKEEEEEAGQVVSGLKLDEDLALVLSTFALVFAAEWGDKSFLATIALSAASNPFGVAAGAIAGHAAATGIAVAGGSALSEYVSERAVAYIGGSLFLVFAAATLIDILV